MNTSLIGLTNTNSDPILLIANFLLVFYEDFNLQKISMLIDEIIMTEIYEVTMIIVMLHELLIHG
jgi:hypothetical protein